MFNWIRRKIHERRRAIYHYWDGARRRKIDPLAAYRALLNHPQFDAPTHLTMVEVDASHAPSDQVDFLVKAAGEAFDVTLQATRDVFDVREWTEDQPGLTQAETRDLLKGFMLYCVALKKNGSPSPTSGAAPSMPPRPPSASSPDMSAKSDSPSTPSESNGDELPEL